MRPPAPPPRVVVVGAGVAGLACAQELRASAPAGTEVIVLEARARVGGRILTHWMAPPAVLPPTLPTTLTSPAAPPPLSAPEVQSVLPLPGAPGPSRAIAPVPCRTPFADLAAGMLVPSRTASDGSLLHSVDVGASIMHGCGDDNQLVFARAVDDKIRAPVVAGGGFYESTEHAVWFDDATGARISTEKIVEIHNIFFMASRYMAAVASQSDDAAANMQAIFNCGVDYVCQHLGPRPLSQIDLAILNKICARSVGYCSPMAVMALMQASAGMDSTCADTHIGATFEEDDPPFPGELPSMSPSGIKQQATRLVKAIIATQKTPKPMIASKKGGSGDRVVLDGYTPFLIDRLKEGVDVRLAQAVCGVSCAVKVPVESTHDLSEDFERGRAKSSSTRSRKRARPEEPTNSTSSWHTDPEVAQRTIFVSTRSGEVYEADFVVITLPLGVLKGDHEESSITFSPPLSDEKQEAIRGMGMGVHNKLVLRFREEDVFWPPKIPQINCLDPRFQFFNLHSYGKTGVLLVQVFAESGFANGYWDLPDAGVVAEVLMVLGGMFCNSQTAAEPPNGNSNGQLNLAAARAAIARRRVSRLLNICEQCKREVQSRVVADASGREFEHVCCMSCGLVVQLEKEDPQVFHLQDEQNEIAKDVKSRFEGAGRPDGLSPESEHEEMETAPRQRNLTWANFPAPEEYIVTRWDQDPFSLGSYSYMPCGSSWQMIDQMAAPEPRDCANPYLFFAGEHCSDLGWQCVHGAYETGLRAARDIVALLSTEPPHVNSAADVSVADVPVPRTIANRGKSRTLGRDPFWTHEREKALTRSLIGYSDVYGNYTDVMDEISHALQTFKKEPTDLNREEVLELVLKRIHDRIEEEDEEAKAFMNFHKGGKGMQEDMFPRPFMEIHKRPRLVGLNGSKLKEIYADDIVQELKRYAHPVFENQISYRETLRKIALMIYKKDGGLMTKRCLSEYLRTQEFGTGPQKELFLEKYLPPK